MRLYAASGTANSSTNLMEAVRTRLPIVLDAAGANPIAVSIVVTSRTGTADVAAALNWREIR